MMIVFGPQNIKDINSILLK